MDELMVKGIDIQQPADPKTVAETVRALNVLAPHIGLTGSFRVLNSNRVVRLDYVRR